MPILQEGNLTFSFSNDWQAIKYDDSSFHTKYFQSFAGGSKAVDFIAFGNQELWLIEVKDYRLHARTKSTDLYLEIASKVRATLAGLLAITATNNPSGDSETKSIAQSIFKRSYQLRIALHLEQPIQHSKLFPQVIDPKTARDKLRQQLRSVDPHALVGDKTFFNAQHRWGVT